MNTESIILVVMAIIGSEGLWSYIRYKAEIRHKRKYENKTAEQKLLLGLAFKTIVDTCQEHISDGEIAPEEYKELNHYLFKPYQELGGDGTASRLIKEVESLPIKKEVKS